MTRTSLCLHIRMVVITEVDALMSLSAVDEDIWLNLVALNE
jgi:hypothetical protein